MKNIRLVSFIFRMGVASAYLYAGIGSLIDADSWMGFLPKILRASQFSGLILLLFSIYEIALCVWLISGKKGYLANLLSSLTMFVIIITNLSVLDIVFRDIPILFSSIGLMILYKEETANNLNQ